MTLFVSPELMSWIVFVFVIGSALFWIVRRHLDRRPPASRRVLDGDAEGEVASSPRRPSPGPSSAARPTGAPWSRRCPLPCRPVAGPAARRRPGAAARSAPSSAGVARSAVTTKFESGTSTPVIPCDSSSAFEGSTKRSSQTTSLARNRSHCAARTAPSLGGVLRASRSAGTPPRGRSGRSSGTGAPRSTPACSSRSAPGASSFCAFCDALLAAGAASPSSALLELGLLDAGRRQRVVEVAADRGRVVRRRCCTRPCSRGTPRRLALRQLLDPEDEHDHDEDREPDQERSGGGAA